MHATIGGLIGSALPSGCRPEAQALLKFGANWTLKTNAGDGKEEEVVVLGCFHDEEDDHTAGNVQFFDGDEEIYLPSHIWCSFLSSSIGFHPGLLLPAPPSRTFTTTTTARVYIQVPAAPISPRPPN